MNVSIVVVCYNEEKNIARCLESLLHQELKQDKYEILVIDNNSSDRTRGIIKEYENQGVRLEINPARGIAASRKMGIEKATYDFVAFTDADCVVPENWLQILISGYDRYGEIYKPLGAVGGANLLPDDSKYFTGAVSIVLHSYWGSHGSTQGMVFKKDTVVTHIPCVNILYNKKAVLEAGNFDPSFDNICEDPELNYRLWKAGYRFVFLKDSFVWHKFAPNLWIWIKKVFTYGKGRVWIIKKHPSHLRIKFLIPPLFVLSQLAVLLSFRYPLFLIFLLYYTVILLISIFECLRKKRISLIPLVFLIYILTHFCYGFGEFYGVFKKRGI